MGWASSRCSLLLLPIDADVRFVCIPCPVLHFCLMSPSRLPTIYMRNDRQHGEAFQRAAGAGRPPVPPARAGWSGRGSRLRAPGFTLIEVLVALTIIAIALMASLRAVGSITASSADLRARTLAQWSAENRLTEIRVRREFPAVGRRHFDCPQGDLLLICQEDVYTTANPNFRRIEIQVFDAENSRQGAGGAREGGRLARLLGFAVVDNTAVR